MVGDQPRLAALLPLRRALALGGPLPAPLELPESDPRAQVERQWRAQLALLRESPEETRASLAAFPTLSNLPLLEILRARTHFLTSGDVDTALGYRRALELLPPYDGLWLEAALILHTLGFESRAESYLESLAAMGTRHADVYYSLAELALLDGSVERATTLFQSGFELRPLARDTMLESSLLSVLLAPEGRIFPLFAMDRAEEPSVAPARRSQKALRLPAGAQARVSGAYLRIDFSGGSLTVPGGAAIAPSTTRVVPAGEWSREEEAQALAELPELREVTALAGALSHPRLRRQLELVASALAREHNWEELVDLTEGVADQIGTVEAEVLRLRATALEQLGRGRESASLLAKLVSHIVTRERRDPRTLYQLADVLATQGRYDTAIRLIRKANSQLPSPMADARIQQIRLEQRLAEGFERLESEHFEVLYPPQRGELAPRIAAVLEAERSRLAQWIPLRKVEPVERIEVHLMSFEDFSELYGGSIDVLGIYDGRIRVPLADIWGFHPFLVSLLSHELAHAMIAQYTKNQAPKWFHEGVAQLVEMTDVRVNPIEDYQRTGRLLSFPVVEGVLQGFPTPAMVATAYDEALWTLCYVQSVHGVRKVHGLLEAFRSGRPTAGALEEVFGMTPVEFDRALREWWLHDAPMSWTTEVHYYETFTDPYVQRPGEEPLGRQLQTRWWQQNR